MATVLELESLPDKNNPLSRLYIVKMAAARQVASSGLRQTLSKFLFNRAYYPQLGLLTDDTLRETEVVTEAIRRLPDNLYDERMFRITRALHLSLKKETLPKAEWTTFETDVKYLTPFVEEVEREFQEKREWAAK
ncbi:DgyrCDS2737 [Dimorphilus gyrociliatus]|uniref:Cytochrome b-c1 complex subunit 7 n=1 Tax=Dimorphilus gyrociliatus TaxID=2664684 RepID=A0A7I8VB59_9ANNE|nr:DgyrCDS2737 [Dimorphilus gyrociliatus]